MDSEQCFSTQSGIWSLIVKCWSSVLKNNTQILHLLIFSLPPVLLDIVAACWDRFQSAWKMVCWFVLEQLGHHASSNKVSSYIRRLHGQGEARSGGLLTPQDTKYIGLDSTWKTNTFSGLVFTFFQMLHGYFKLSQKQTQLAQ